jgi:hypothetical protein
MGRVVGGTTRPWHRRDGADRAGHFHGRGNRCGGTWGWVRPRLILDIIGAVGPRYGVTSANGARYEDTCVDRCTALDGLAGRSAATATTGAWCRRPAKQFDPSKQRPYMY